MLSVPGKVPPVSRSLFAQLSTAFSGFRAWFWVAITRYQSQPDIRHYARIHRRLLSDFSTGRVPLGIDHPRVKTCQEARIFLHQKTLEPGIFLNISKTAGDGSP